MQNDIKQALHKELDNYLEKGTTFSPYYPGMKVLSSNLYTEQLKDLLKEHNEADGKSFKLYLDTIIVNMHTKVRKYKQSVYFDNENIKDIQNQGLTIVFFIDDEEQKYILLGIVKPELSI
ncbi:MAG: hypothetical protein Q9M32_03440 [Sulfurimonas sp.]|nr:hypothetical protein [Sulfurimonas sp.]MDQ7060175.1 hypothetical protein [Sulfurimonas sp.]